MSRLGEAIALAAEVHAEQLDKADAPYILHALAVMEGCRPHGEDAMVVGVLHDVLEDCDPLRAVELSDTIYVRFGQRVHTSVVALTKKKGQEYTAYVEDVAFHHLARIAKIEDLKHNMDPRRIPSYQIVDKDFERWTKYRKALIRLEREA